MNIDHNNNVTISAWPHQELYDSDEAVYEVVRRGHAWGSIVFSANYSESVLERSEQGRFADQATLDFSDVNVRLDQSSKCVRNRT